MSLDPFEARLQFLKLLRHLNASQASIQKVVSFAVKYGARCGEDLWDCIMQECAKGSLNTRINVLYFLDSLCESASAIGPPDAPYATMVERDLAEIVERVVPSTKDGWLNLRSAKQILESWRTRRVIEPSIVDPVLKLIDQRQSEDRSKSPRKRDREEPMSRGEVVQRIEEDRERQKRLRERMWILPIPPLLPPRGTSSSAVPSPASPSPFTPASPRSSGRPPASHLADPTTTTGQSGTSYMPPPPLPRDKGLGGDKVVGAEKTEGESALEVEFEIAWETTSDLGEDDEVAMADDAKRAIARE